VTDENKYREVLRPSPRDITSQSRSVAKLCSLRSRNAFTTRSNFPTIANDVHISARVVSDAGTTPTIRTWQHPGGQPMAGSGQIMRVYDDRAVWASPQPWDLDIRMFDLSPRGPYAKLIRANDLTVRLPIKRANYIVLDLPYFGMAKQQYSNKKKDLSNMDERGWTTAIKAVARSCSKAQKSGDLCTVISPNYRSLKDGHIFLATVVVRTAFLANGYQLYDLAYASRRIQQTQNVGMAVLNNAAKGDRLMLTDIAEIMTFRRRR
jgi:hypothetical protein